MPTGQLITQQPAHCGITDTTIDTLVPQHELQEGGGGQESEWDSETDHERRERHLRVEFRIQHRRYIQAATTNAPTTPVSQAIEQFATVLTGDGVRPVTGIGDEAVNGAYTAATRIAATLPK